MSVPPPEHAAIQASYKMMEVRQQKAETSGREDCRVGVEVGQFLDRFLQCHPPQFLPIPNKKQEAELWIEQMEEIFTVLNCTEQRKVQLATFQLQGPAQDFWLKKKEVHKREQKEWTWADFQKEFKSQFIPRWIVEKKEDEFQNLKQEGWTVAWYAVDFTRLSMYCLYLVQDEVDRIRRLIHGLHPKLSRILMGMAPPTYSAAVDIA
jgi:hypothetical protein